MISDVSKLGFSSNLFDSSNSILSSKANKEVKVSNQKDDFKSQVEAKTKADTKSKPEIKEKAEVTQEVKQAIPVKNIQLKDIQLKDTQVKNADVEIDEAEDTLPANLPEAPKGMIVPQQQVSANQPKDYVNPKDVAVFEANEIKSKEAADEKKPVIKFMQFMKDNYDVEPKEIVEAMNSLSQEQLMATPQDSMYAFFNKLGILNDNIAPAKEQYLNMLNELNKIENVKENKNINVEVVDPKKQRLQELNRKLDQMNASFFMAPPMKSAQNTPLSVSTEGLESKLSPDKFFQDNKNLVKQNVNTQEVSNEAVVYKPQKVELPTTVSVLSETEKAMPVAQSVGEGVELNQIKEFAKNNELKMDIQQLSAQLNNLEKSFNSETNTKDKEQSLDDSNYLGLSQDKQVDSKPTVSTFANELKTADKSGNQTENIKNIINQSQMMIKKGGGEMKLQLHPEGIGHVNLKVKVEEGGKVGIQMVADTADAKRLLEGSLNDLKSHLAQHKMSVDTFKVDVSDKFSDGLNQQSDLNREEARNFLGQFREQNEQFRNPFHNDNPGMRMYRSYGGKAPQTRPEETSVQTASLRKNNNGRLHLVA